LIGLLNLGSRLSEQEYSSDDIALLNNLAAQATPAVRVAQLVQEQQIEIQERERFEQEMQVARLIQQTLLPKELPQPPGWKIACLLSTRSRRWRRFL
jgi:serine phosphatase RsbU (regulator of sigma subunit)